MTLSACLAFLIMLAVFVLVLVGPYFIDRPDKQFQERQRALRDAHRRVIEQNNPRGNQ